MKNKELSVELLTLYREFKFIIDSKLNKILAEKKITKTQFSVLDLLAAEGDMKMCDLVKFLYTTKGNMTLVIKNMEDKNLIYRKNSDIDKRVTLVSLTELGRKTIETAIPCSISFSKELCSNLTEKELEEFIKLFKKLNKKEI